MYVSSKGKELELYISPQALVLLTDQEAMKPGRHVFHLINPERCASSPSDAIANAWLTALLIVKGNFRQQWEVGMNISELCLDSYHWGHGPGMERVGDNLARGLLLNINILATEGVRYLMQLLSGIGQHSGIGATP